MDQGTTEFASTIEPLLGPPMEPNDAGSVGEYRLIEKIGQGGMGVVYRARKAGADRDIAVKILAPALLSSPKARQRFLREAALAAELQHERLTGLVDLGETDGLPFIAMPLLQGESLEQRLRREPRSDPSLILRVACETAEGLIVIHRKGILHRDIKPSNLWLENGAANDIDDPHIKILDLGLARRMDEDERFTSAGIMMGTPEYMAPEHVRGDDGDVRSDLFSVGCVLYRMATGSPPFPGSNLMAVLRALALTKPQPPNVVNSAISQGLSDLIMDMIARDPSHRPASAEDVVKALERIDDFRSIAPTNVPDRVVEQTPKRRRSRVLLLGSLAAGVVTVCVGFGVFLMIAHQAAVENGPAAPPVKPKTPLPVAEKQPPPIFQLEGELTNADPFDKVRPKCHSQTHVANMLVSKAYVVELSSSAFDAYLTLEKTDGTVLKFDDDSGGGTNARILFRPPTDGEYRINVSSFDPGKTGKFLLTVKEARQAELLQERITSTARLNEIEIVKVTEDIVAFLDTQKLAPTNEGAHLALAAVRGFDLPGSPKAAQWCLKWCPKLAAALAPASDATIKSKSRFIAGIGRRYGLPGNALEVAGTTLHGKKLDWAPYRDKVVLVDFWATTSPLCTLDLPELKRYYRAYREKGFEILSVNLDRDVNLAARFWENHDIPWSSLHEKLSNPQSLELQYGISSVPMRFLVDRKGKVVSINARDLELSRLLKLHLGDYSESIMTIVGPPTSGFLTNVALSADGKRIASGSGGGNGVANVWDSVTGEKILTIKAHSGWIGCASFSADGSRILTCGSDSTIKVWDAAKGDELLTIKGYRNGVLCASFSPDGKRIVSSGVDSPILKVWDATTGQEMLELKGHVASARTAMYSGDGTRIVTAGFDANVKVWDAKTGQEIVTLKGHTLAVMSASFSPDGQRVVSASADATVRIWDATTGKERTTLKHLHPVLSASFTGDGKRVVSGGNEKVVQIWNAESGAEIASLMGHELAIVSIACSQDGTRIVTGGADRTIRVWNATGRE